MGPPQFMAVWDKRGPGPWGPNPGGPGEWRGGCCGGGGPVAVGAWGGDGCSDWARDWHQQGCGFVHVHNLGDWTADHHGYRYGWPYGGWDPDFWPYIRNDGGAAWYRGGYASAPPAPPVWFDAQWQAVARS